MREEEPAFHVRSEMVVPSFFRNFESVGRPIDSSVIDENVNRSEFLLSLKDRRLALTGVSNIEF